MIITLQPIIWLGLKTDDFGVLPTPRNKSLMSFFTLLHVFKSDEGINKLRSEMFQEAEENLLKNLDKTSFILKLQQEAVRRLLLSI